MKIITIRHGETEWNVQGREMGQLDSPLTPRGLQQAKAIAKRLSNHPFSTLYSSDLGRARQTAELIGAACKLPIQIHQGLRERNMGIFQGLTRQEMSQKFPAEMAAYKQIGFEYVIPNGESAKQRYERSVRTMTELANRHPEPDATIVAVTHGGFLRGFFEYVLDMPPTNGWRFKRYNASYSAFEFKDNNWILETWNDIGHLQDMETLHDSV
ncbi:MAG: histidine phosphatase family protein [Chloroflexota bacterium]